MEANIAKSITINSSYAELLPSFNDDLQSAVDAALQRYLIDEIARQEDEPAGLPYIHYRKF